MNVNEKLALPVPYTLEMKGNGTFIAKWEPSVRTPGLPIEVRGESESSGIHALERLLENLVKHGVVES